jgi:lauroyl/myristoyl acyltransferase
VTDWGYRVAALLARRLPPGMGGRVAETLADLYVTTHPRAARAARPTYRDFARSVYEFLREARSDRPARVTLDAPSRDILDRLRAARATGAPETGRTLVLSGHFGPWETALRWLASEVGPLDALAAPHRSAAVERFFASHRAEGGIRTLSGHGSAARALRGLRAGGWIAALVDRSCVRRRHVRGLDGVVPIDRAPLLLARRAEARVLAGVSWRSPDGALHVRFLEPFAVGSREGGLPLAQAARRLQRFFDEHVLEHPSQWYAWDGARAGR